MMRGGICFYAIVLVIFCAQAFAYDWSTNPGDGSPENPYQISEPNHLMSIGSNADLLDKHFILTNDIIFDPNNNPTHVFSKAVIAADASFSGVFDGNGYRICNIVIDTHGVGNDCLGLFAYINDKAKIRNLGIENIKISAEPQDSESIGGLCGGAFDVDIDRCYVTGNIIGATNIGGLIGSVSTLGARVTNCHTVVSLTGSSYVGGLTGRQYSGSIRNCYTAVEILTVGGLSSYIGGLCGWTSACSISDSHAIAAISENSGSSAFCLGGLVGKIMHASIRNCYSNVHISVMPYSHSIGGLVGTNYGAAIVNSSAHCDISGGDGSIGGLCGDTSYENSRIEKCHSSGRISTDNIAAYFGYIGGLCGNNSEDTNILNCYSLTDVSTDVELSKIGGFCGTSRGMIKNCYSLGSVIGVGSYIGGFLGSNTNGIVDSCYFLDTSGPDNGYGTPLDDPNMMIQANFIGWDFVGEDTNGENEIWRMCVDGVDYPRLSWEFSQNGDFACGDGVDLADLQSLAEHWLLVGMADPTEFNYACDANGDEIINLEDFSVLSENWP